MATSALDGERTYFKGRVSVILERAFFSSSFSSFFFERCFLSVLEVIRGRVCLVWARQRLCGAAGVSAWGGEAEDRSHSVRAAAGEAVARSIGAWRWAVSLRGSRGSVRSPGGLRAGWLSSVHQAAMKKGKLAKGKSRKYGIQCLIVWGES